MAVRGRDEPALTLSAPNLARVAKEAKAADKRITRRMRASIRAAGQSAVGDVRAEIDKIPSSGRFNTGIRTGLKAGTGVSISVASPRTAKVIIATRGAKLPPGKRPLVKALNRPSFRRPVFPDPTKPRSTWTYVEQQGRPYFGAAILAHRQELEAGIWRALVQAQKEIAKAIEKGAAS